MCMTLLKIASILFIFLTIILTIIITKLFRLKRFGLNFADLAFPLFVLEFYVISDRAFYQVGKKNAHWNAEPAPTI